MTSPLAGTRLAVVGTAGHIDHGKTALVRRLTGVDTDRLPEEKKRGISIDLGFAPLVTPAGVQVGIVDVPGHERFVKNMLAGVGGIDLVLLVIASDEGVMPQTREHLAIVSLLGVCHGIVALTKCDLVEHDWLDAVREDVRSLLAKTALAAAPILEFSAVNGQGQKELLAAIDRELAQVPPRGAEDPPRLPVDRVFTVEGFGTVVTGTLWRGRVRVGDVLELLPARRNVRVRRVQVHGATIEEARAGQRTAVALHGVERDRVERGDWLVGTGSLRPSSVLDVRFELLADVPRDWPARSRVRFHLGAAELIGRLQILEGTTLRPGGDGLAQVRLERPAVAARGDRFVVRSYSPARTIGGGTVIEPVASRRRRAAAIDQLKVHERGSVEARLVQRLAQEIQPTTTADLAQRVGESEAEAGRALECLAVQGEVVSPSPGRWVAGTVWTAAREQIVHEVDAYAARYPARYGVMKGDLKSGLKAVIDPALFDAAFEFLAAAGTLEMRGERVRSRGEPWQPPPEVMLALERLESELETVGMAVPETSAWRSRLGATASEVVALGGFLGRLVRVNQQLTYTARQLEELRGRLVVHFAHRPTLTVTEFKDLSGVSRKYAVPLLEHCDRVGWTVRSGDERTAGGRLAPRGEDRATKPSIP